MKNPFVYGEAVSGEYFCDRVHEINELLTDIKGGLNVIIFSPRRYGKTSLIRRVLEDAKAEGLFTFYIDLYPAINKQRFIEIYAKAISAGLPGKVSRIAKKLKEYMPRIIPKVVMDDQSMRFEFEFDRTADISPHIDDLLEAAQKRLSSIRKMQLSSLMNSRRLPVLMMVSSKGKCALFSKTIGMFPIYSWEARHIL